MWIKLDDGFATHPKILSAGPLAVAVQIRALCYASQHRTDGFLHDSTMPFLFAGIDLTPGHMMKHGLWDQVKDGYEIHDYLEWNCSKRDYERWKKKLSQAGKKGMNHRWNKENSDVTKVIRGDISSPVTSSSTSTAILKEGKESEKGEPKWLQELRRNPVYAHVNWDRELGKIRTWKQIPANRHRVINYRFVLNWVNKIEPPVSMPTSGTHDWGDDFAHPKLVL